MPFLVTFYDPENYFPWHNRALLVYFYSVVLAHFHIANKKYSEKQVKDGRIYFGLEC